MKKLFYIALFFIGISSANAQWTYPPTRTVDSTDTYWGKTFKDPYRWLEKIKEDEVERWFRSQAHLTDSLLGRIHGRDELVKEWVSLDKLKPSSYSDITYEGGRVFYKKTNGGENVGKLYCREGWNGREKLLFDPSTYKAGVTTSIQGFLPSFDGKNVVLGLSSGGAEVSELRVLNVGSGALLADSIYPSWFGPISWTPDNTSFFYFSQKTADNKSAEFELNTKTKLHKLGENSSNDIDFFSNESYPDLNIAPNELPFAGIDESYPKYIFANLGNVRNEMRVYYAPTSELSNAKLHWKSMCQPSDSLVRGMEYYKDNVYAVTLKDAPRYRLISTSVDNPDWNHAKTIIPEQKDAIQYIAKSKNYLLIVYSNGIVNRILKYNLDNGQTADIRLPSSGTVNVFCPDRQTNRYIMNITSWTLPLTWYNYDADQNVFTKSNFNSDVTYPGFDNLVTEEVEASGHDGAMVPLSIIHKKGLQRDGSNCCIISGYGAYGISAVPAFSIFRSLALRGVVLAIAHVRGGSEKGESWYKAGYKTTKPNTWKDFISCGEYLVKQGYTSPQKLSGMGTSAGGILISRAVTERPDLFGAAICNVGMANAMRAEMTPNGPANIPEFGTVKDSLECMALYEMDGMLHVQQGVKYPAVICIGGWNDPRVVAWQPGKFAAALQQASSSAKPVLMKVNFDNGHFTEDKEVTYRNFADQYSFVLWQTGHPDFQPAK